MTVDELRAERRALREELRRLEASGTDALTLQRAREALLDANAALRRMTPGHRAGARRVSDGALDRKQYEDWAAQSWAEYEAAGLTWAEAERSTARLREAVRNAGALLTATEKRYFDLLAAGRRPSEIAAACGVDGSTVSRSLDSAKRKLNRAAAALGAADPDYGGPGVRIDAADPAAARLLLGACTAKQLVYLYLYYGEWLSCQETARLLGVDKASALRGVERGLRSIGRLFPGKALLLDNMDALGEPAYALFLETDWTGEGPEAEERPRGFGAYRPDWGRRALGLSTARPRRDEAPPEIAVATSGGRASAAFARRKETASAPRGRLLTALLARLGDGQGVTLRRWLLALFGRLRRAVKPT